MSFIPKMSFFAVLLSFTFTLALFSCNKADQSATKEVSDGELIAGPVRHDSLSTYQMEKIKKIHSTFAEVDPLSLEETIEDFKRDKHPDNEIAVWLAMASTYEKFFSKNPSTDLAKKLEVYKVILTRSMENEAETKAKTEVKILTDKEVDEILSYYNLEAKPIVVEQKN